MDKMMQEDAVVIRGDAVKIIECQYAGGKLSRAHLPAGSKDTHGLVIKKAERQPVKPRRFHPALFQVKLD